MKAFIAISDNNGMESKIDTRFGRGNYFMTYDMDNDIIVDVEENKFREDGHGVGIKTAGIAVEKGCALVMGARPGPKAEQVFVEGKVEIFVITEGTVNDAIRSYRKK